MPPEFQYGDNKSKVKSMAQNKQETKANKTIKGEQVNLMEQNILWCILNVVSEEEPK